VETRFLDPYAETQITQNRLPHWEQDGATYFVTFHTNDSIPEARLSEWNSERDAWLNHHPKPWSQKTESEYHQRFSRRIEEWLDQGHGTCPLRQDDALRTVADSLQFFEGVRSVQHAFVVMPNHVHALFSLVTGIKLRNLVWSWKRFTAGQIADGPLWQKDYFDRLIRDEDHFWNCARYIRRNPLKAHLRPGDYLLWESDLVRECLDAEG
jgi:REP element-mobilizing transposase RayT